VVPQNAEDVWPFRQKELLVEINKEISPSINGYDITSLNAEYDLLKKHPEFVYKPHKMASPQYSAAFVKWVVEQFKKDPKLFIRARAYYSRRIRNRKR